MAQNCPNWHSSGIVSSKQKQKLIRTIKINFHVTNDHSNNNFGIPTILSTFTNCADSFKLYIMRSVGGGQNGKEYLESHCKIDCWLLNADDLSDDR